MSPGHKNRASPSDHRIGSVTTREMHILAEWYSGDKKINHLPNNSKILQRDEAPRCEFLFQEGRRGKRECYEAFFDDRKRATSISSSADSRCLEST